MVFSSEGLQHEDGHGIVQAGLIPNCRSYDPRSRWDAQQIAFEKFSWSRLWAVKQVGN